MTAPRKLAPAPVPVPAGGEAQYNLTLFVSGASDLSARAIYDARRLCDVHLRAASQLTVLDVHDAPEAALRGGIHVVPTLVRNLPLPVRRVVGDLSQTQRVLSALLAKPAVHDAVDEGAPA
jgi:circadian clock protein KaiB